MKKTLRNKAFIFAVAALLFLSVMTFAIHATAPTAKDFCDAVDAVVAADALRARENALENATDVLSAYKLGGGSVEDADIADAYAVYLTEKADIETRVEACATFVDAVSAALDETAPYVTVRDNLDLAESLWDTVDDDYGSVALHKEFWLELTAELEEPIEVCEGFLLYAKQAAEAKTYADAKKYMDLADAAKKAMTILDYPGLDEAEENLAAAKDFMYQQIYNATPFCDAVKNISKAKSIPIGVTEAYEALKTVDETAENAVTALSNLKKIERNYNKSVKTANETAEEATELLFYILF